MKYLGITMGDPAGIGAEISLKALEKNEGYRDCSIIYGSIEVLKYYKSKLNIITELWEIKHPKEFKKGKINVISGFPLDVKEFEIGKVSEICGKASYLYIAKAIEDALLGDIKVVVTAPLNKESLNRAGYSFQGHTEIFAKLTNTEKYSMMLWSDQLAVVHVSTHCSLMEACKRVKQERVFEVIELAEKAMKDMGIKSPKIAVAGLNPHSGESGLFGSEEIEEITPAIEKAKKKGWDVDGPIPPDTVFLKAVQKKYDIVVAMYHDQGHIPMKLLAFDSGVNMTLGLPIIRTSVDHGTAFDIAGKGIANENSLLCALDLGKRHL